jgi:hypothetical protein
MNLSSQEIPFRKHEVLLDEGEITKRLCEAENKRAATHTFLSVYALTDCRRKRNKIGSPKKGLAYNIGKKNNVYKY